MKTTRKEALEAGEQYFFTGRKCLRGHIAKRLVSSGQCTICSAKHAKEYNYMSKEEIQEMEEWKRANG